MHSTQSYFQYVRTCIKLQSQYSTHIKMNEYPKPFEVGTIYKMNY